MDRNHNVIIIGAGSAGRLLAKDIRRHQPNFSLLGFIDDEEKGKNILGTTDDFSDILSLYRVDEIIIAIPTTDGLLIRKILLANIKNRIPIRIVPRSQRVISQSEVSYDQLQKISSEDFLGRSLVKLNIKKLKKFYQGQVVFVTGGAGSIGSAIVQQLLELGVKKVVCFDHSEYLTFQLDQKLKEAGVTRQRFVPVVGNIQDAAKVKQYLCQYQPAIVFHIAAYKHVYLMEENVSEAIKNNVVGTKIMADSAIACGIKRFTFVSTDKVVNPESVMGSTKKLAEFYLQSLNSASTQFTIVRFGNVINSQGSVLPLFARQIKNNRYVTLTDKKMKRFFMSIREAAQLVIQSTAYDQRGGIFILNMGELINIYDVARCLIRSFGLIPGQDVAIKLIGRKGGEKLIEELYTRREYQHLAKTASADIWCLHNIDRFAGDVSSTISSLQELAGQGAPDRKIKKKLADLFPSLRNK